MKTALYTLEGNLVMVGSLQQTYDHLYNVLGVGGILQVGNLTDREIANLKYKDALDLVESRKNKNV